MIESPITKILRDPLLSRTIRAAVIADGLLLLPFFFTANLFSKILPSGNTSSLAVLLIFSLVALHLSNTYDRLRTAGLLYMRRRMLNVLAPQEGILLFTRGRELTPHIRLLQTMMISLRSGDFVVVAGAALQVFFPIAVLILTLFVSFKLFLLIFIFLLMYGYVFQYKMAQQSKGDQSDRIAAVRQSWFYRWMGASPRRMRFYFTSPKYLNAPWTGASEAAKMGAFRYSASLLLLSLAAFLIIADNLPTGFLLPISFFSQRLLQPAERIRQISTIFKLFTLAAANPVKKTSIENAAVATVELPASPIPVNSFVIPGSSAAPHSISAGSRGKVDGLHFIAPLEIRAGKFKVKLAESFEIQSGQICVVSAGVGQGKTILLESILGIRPIHIGRIDLKTQYNQPWDLIRYMNQSDFFDSKEEQSFYTLRLNDIQDILAETKGQLLAIDDPLMGMDARARNHVVEKLTAAKAAGATMVIASNDRQLVDLADHWLTINDVGEMQLRKKDVPA
jgi:ABC-type protease/lipase transport system fused ATPase/permease subunit